MKIKLFALIMAVLMAINSIMTVSVAADNSVDYEEDIKVYSAEITDASNLQSTNVLYVVLKKEYSDPDANITRDYFPELNIIGLKDLMKINNPSERKYLNEDNYRHILKIYLGDSSLEYLNTAKNLLEARNDVKYVSAA